MLGQASHRRSHSKRELLEGKWSHQFHVNPKPSRVNARSVKAYGRTLWPAGRRGGPPSPSLPLWPCQPSWQCFCWCKFLTETLMVSCTSQQGGRGEEPPTQGFLDNVISSHIPHLSQPHPGCSLWRTLALSLVCNVMGWRMFQASDSDS